MPLPNAPVALGPELRPRPKEREVDVEEDGSQHETRIGRRPARVMHSSVRGRRSRTWSNRATRARRRRTAPQGADPCDPGAHGVRRLCGPPIHPTSLRGRRTALLSGRARTGTSVRRTRGGGTWGNHRGPPTIDRGAQIRTGDLSDPNGARYQAAPHPERAQGSGSFARRLAAIAHPIRNRVSSDRHGSSREAGRVTPHRAASEPSARPAPSAPAGLFHALRRSRWQIT